MTTFCAAGAKQMTLAIHEWASGAYAQRARDYRAGQKLFLTAGEAQSQAITKLRDQYYQLFRVTPSTTTINGHLQAAMASQGWVVPATNTTWDQQLPYWQKFIDLLPLAFAQVSAAYLNQAAAQQQAVAQASAAATQASIEAMRSSSRSMAESSGAAAAKAEAASKKAAAQRRVGTVLLVLVGAVAGSAAAYGIWRVSR
jgi:hypothetical protein